MVPEMLLHEQHTFMQQSFRVRFVPELIHGPDFQLNVHAPDVHLSFRGGVHAHIVNEKWAVIDKAINWVLPQIEAYIRRCMNMRVCTVDDPCFLLISQLFF